MNLDLTYPTLHRGIFGRVNSYYFLNYNEFFPFLTPHFNDQKIVSIQGYGIDDNRDIYISSQPSPHTTFLGFPRQGKPREIIKIPWGMVDPDKWSVVNLDNSLKLDALDFCTEFEGIQVTSDCLYLTVAYHQRNSDLTTLMNRIYQVKKF